MSFDKHIHVCSQQPSQHVGHFHFHHLESSVLPPPEGGHGVSAVCFFPLASLEREQETKEWALITEPELRCAHLGGGAPSATCALVPHSPLSGPCLFGRVACYRDTKMVCSTHKKLYVLAPWLTISNSTIHMLQDLLIISLCEHQASNQLYFPSPHKLLLPYTI